MRNRKTIQISLVFIGIVLILATYLYYPKINENKIAKKNKTLDIEANQTEDSTLNTFDNVEYKGLYDFDKPFTVQSKKAYILPEEPDVVFMEGMKVILVLSDNRIVVITSDKGSYNKIKYDCIFEENVKATDGKTTILSQNLDLLASNDKAIVFNDVILTNDKSSLEADKIEYNFISNQYRVSMFKKNEKVNIKLVE